MLKKEKRYLLIAILVLLLGAVILGCAAFNKLSKVTGGELSLGSVVKKTLAGEMKLKGVTNILLLGVDCESPEEIGNGGNADGIMLVTVNADTRELILTSFMRDTKVSVDEYRRDKLTHVFRDGGIELFKSVFEKNFEITIDNYAIFYYPDIIDIVDELGGIKIDIAEEEIWDTEAKIRAVADVVGENWEDYLINWYGPGVINMNGLQVAGYLRIRPAYGDYDSGRTERARYVATCMLDKLYKKSLSEKVDFAAMVFSKIQTDLNEDMILKLAFNAVKIKGFDRISDKIPIDGAYSSEDNGNGYYAVPDFEVNNKHLQESLYKGIHKTASEK